MVDLFLQYLNFYGQEVPAEQAREFLLARRDAGDSVLLVAVHGNDGRADDVVGFAQVYPTWSSVSLGPVWVLNDLFVDPADRGSGAGRALVRATAERATEAGAVRVAVTTAWDNMAAQSLYESEGFARDADFIHYAHVTVIP